MNKEESKNSDMKKKNSIIVIRSKMKKNKETNNNDNRNNDNRNNDNDNRNNDNKEKRANLNSATPAAVASPNGVPPFTAPLGGVVKASGVTLGDPGAAAEKRDPLDKSSINTNPTNWTSPASLPFPAGSATRGGSLEPPTVAEPGLQKKQTLRQRLYSIIPFGTKR